MSGLYGLLHEDGRPVGPEDLAPLGRAMAPWGPDGHGSLCEGPVGLGHLRRVATPEARQEALPAREGGLLFTACARLDAPEALGARAGEGVPDTLLLARALAARGEACLEGLPGDWALAAWDPERRRLLLARDPYGQTSLYWTRDRGRLAFASSQKALLALPGLSRDLDDLRLAQVLAAWPGDGTATAYRAIHRLPPAHVLTWCEGQVQVLRTWDLGAVEAVRLGSDDAYVEAFLDEFARAVRVRLRRVRPLGTTLSGGLDSSSVTALAARELGDEPLTGLTSVPALPPDPRPGRLGDEGPLAGALALRWPGLRHETVDARDTSPLEGIERHLGIHDEPGHAAGNQYWIQALLRRARDLDLGVLLTGQGGNAGISWSGGAFRAWRLLRAGAPGAAWGELAAWKRERRLSWLQALRGQLLAPLRASLRPPPVGAWRAYSALHPDFARRLRLDERMREAGHDPGFSAAREPLAVRLAILQPGASIVGALWAEAGEAHGLEVRDPTSDVRLLQFCLGCPDDQFGRGGRERWLLRRGMADLLPPALLENPLRGLQAADLGRRLRAQRAQVEAWLARMEASEACASRLDLPRMRRVLEGPPGASQVASVLCRGLGVGRFLLG